MRKIFSNILLIMMIFSLAACDTAKLDIEDKETVSSETQVVSKEETTTDETVAAMESTTAEVTTVKERVQYKEYEMNYSFYPISDETKAMLIKKLTNLKLEKGQKFDMNSLTFKENEQSARNRMISVFVSAIGADTSDINMLECRAKKVELYKIDSMDDCMVFYFKKLLN